MSTTPKRKREKFLPEEDQRLRELVAIHGESSWDIVSKNMKNRNQRQCRERWKHYLSSSRPKAPWTNEEDELLYQKMTELGPKWTKIAKFFDGRTDIQVKTRWMQRFAMFSDLHIKKKRQNPQPRNVQNQQLAYNPNINPNPNPNINQNPIPNQVISNPQEMDIFNPNQQLFEYQSFDNSFSSFDSLCFF